MFPHAGEVMVFITNIYTSLHIYIDYLDIVERKASQTYFGRKSGGSTLYLFRSLLYPSQIFASPNAAQ